MSEEKKYPISEIFVSPQGEGVYTGALMTFIRLAGCSVGKPFPKERYETKVVQQASVLNPLRPAVTSTKALPIYTEQCTLYDGRTFECDTDYRVKERLTVDELLARCDPKIGRICLTGGEPLIHDLEPLVERLARSRYKVHLETSGTKPIPAWMVPHWSDALWITVSPKGPTWVGQTIRYADELKFLVDENFNLEEALKLIEFMNVTAVVYIQPVNGEHTINDANMKRCLELQLAHPECRFRISSQAHKLWGVR